MKFRYIILCAVLAGCAYQPPEAIAAPPAEVTRAPLAEVAPSPVASQPAPAVSAKKFAEWKKQFREKAAKAGVSNELLNKVMAKIYVSEKVISLDKKQPEHKLTKEEYLANVISPARIQKGKDLLKENRAILDEISQKSGVEPEFIVALWGLETGFGENTGGFSVVNSLATLAYEGRRKEFFENELIDALLIIEGGHTTYENMVGSWAGAMGQCQFMPSSFMSYAVDYNGDGKADIWDTEEDVFASIANYLHTVGWGADQATKEKTLMHWNHSNYFVASVFQLAEAIK